MNFFSWFKIKRAKRMRHVKVIEVFLQQNYFHFRPSCGTYEMIYRAAKGVYWDEITGTLYFKGEASEDAAFQIVNEALQNEYYTTLER